MFNTCMPSRRDREQKKKKKEKNNSKSSFKLTPIYALTGTCCALGAQQKIRIRSSVIEFTWLEFHPLESAGVSCMVSIINKKIGDMGTREPLLPSILNQLIACRRKPWLCEQRAGPAREETGFWAEVVIISDGESVCSYSVCVCVFFGCALILSLPRTAAAVKLGPGGIPHRHHSPLPGEHTAGQQPQSLDQRAEVCGATSTWTRLNAHTLCPEVSHPNSKVPRILTPPLVCHMGTKAGKCSEKMMYCKWFLEMNVFALKILSFFYILNSD